jgi:NTE family protein
MKIGLALSGGGAKGFAHLGVLKGLLEQGLQPQIISGVSAGAVAGALFAAGYHPDKILEIFISSKFYRFLRISASLTGLLKMERVEKLYEKYLPATFEELSIPVIVSATDLMAGKTAFFTSGPLIRPIMATCCIPVMFEPMRIDGRMYVDGGILNNLPVEPLIGQCDYIIGIHTNPIDPEMPLKSLRSIMERSLLLAIQNNVKERAAKCNLVIEPPTLHQFTSYDGRKARQIFEVGYEYTLKLTEKLALIKGHPTFNAPDTYIKK